MGIKNSVKHLKFSPPEVFLGKDILKYAAKFTGEHPCQSVISIKLLCNHASAGCSPVNFAAYFQNIFS